MKHIALVNIAVVLSACIASPATTPVAPWSTPSRLSASYYLVTIRGATIDARRPNGSAWHTEAPDQTFTIIGGLIGLAAGQPALGLAIGGALSDDGDTYGPAPFVELSVGGVRHRTRALSPGGTPQWDEVIRIDARALQPSDVIVVSVIDGIDGGSIGHTQMRVSDLVARENHTLTEMGSVAALGLEVAATVPAYAKYDVEVDSAADPDTTVRVPVRGGDLVKVRSWGEACISDTRCYDPDGDKTVISSWGSDEYRDARDSYREFRKVPHASLVGLLSGFPILIGSSAEYRAPRSGEFILFVNDTKVGDNDGQLQVEILINSI